MLGSYRGIPIITPAEYVAGGAFDSKMQMAGVWMDVNNPSEIVIKHAPNVDPWSLPEVPIDQVVSAFRSGEESDRVRILGTLT